MAKPSKRASARTTTSGSRRPAAATVRSAPATYGSVQKSTLPMVNGGPSVRIQHREYVTALTNTGHTGAFWVHPTSASVPGWDLSPASALLFPWLSPIAERFERYKFHKLSFHIVSRNPTSDDGRVYASVDYDYNDNAPATVVEMMHNRTAVSASAWMDLHLACDTPSLHRDMPYRFCQSAQRVAPEPRTSFCGFLTVAFNATATIEFDMYVEYDVELVTPQYDAYSSIRISGPLSTTGNVIAAADAYNEVRLPATTTAALRTVVPGAGSVPALIGLDPTLQPLITSALDVGGLLKGRLDVTSQVNYNAGIDTDNVGNLAYKKNPRMRMEAFDAAGTRLTTTSVSTNQPFLDMHGGWESPADPAALATDTNLNAAAMGIDLAGLRIAYPTLKYLTFILASKLPGVSTAADWRLMPRVDYVL